MILKQDEIFAVCDALIDGGLASEKSREALLEFIDPGYVALLGGGLNPKQQLLKDIGHMNKVERIANGDIPLQIYLQNAAFLLKGIPKPEKVVRATLDLVIRRMSGSPAVDLGNVPEKQEVLVFTDDTVPHVFMELGLKAAEAVVKINVPAFENGQPRLNPDDSQVLGNGTGWYLTSTLVMTNHHVINARREGEPDALAADFQLQGKSAFAIPDYNGEPPGDLKIKGEDIVAWNKELDYAILRFPATNRKPLRLAAAKINLQNTPIPVNIIQHPNGRSKKFAIRNNLVSASEQNDLRYFTDTESGSSGSPVLNDKWEVVALHRGATYVENVQFQGKSTAYINVGTHLLSILEDVKVKFPAIYAELGI
jgi:endonuclease G, mitochondrial